MKEKNAKKYYSLSMVLCFALFLIKVILNYYNERIVKSSCKEHALHLKQIGGGGAYKISNVHSLSLWSKLIFFQKYKCAVFVLSV